MALKCSRGRKVPRETAVFHILWLLQTMKDYRNRRVPVARRVEGSQPQTPSKTTETDAPENDPSVDVNVGGERRHRVKAET